MSERKPVPIFSWPARPRCPVCGYTSYSLAGIHPQCASVASDKVRIARTVTKTVEKPIEPKLKRYEKNCPSCRCIVHVRLIKCGCGHTLLGDKKEF